MRRAPFSVVGFLVGAVLALIFYVVFLALVSFPHVTLVAGLVALLIWAACTFSRDVWW